MPNYLNVGCGMHYAEGWTNTDVWEDDATKPDVIVEHGQPYPFEGDTFDAVYLGHVLEHIAWREVLPFLTPYLVMALLKLTKQEMFMN